MNLKEQIIITNEAYRSGKPIISDAEYDILLSKLEKEMSYIEFEEFKLSLLEKSGDKSHDYVIGSLNKIKYGEDGFGKWLKKQTAKSYFASEKLDGCSFVAEYRNGKFVSCSSRGDGGSGTDWTEAGKIILPQTIDFKSDLDIRGELILTNHEKLGMKNRRNGVSGIMGREDIDPEVLKNIIPYTYQILNGDYSIIEQFYILQENSFRLPKHKIFNSVTTLEQDLYEFYCKTKEESLVNYDIDGLVVSSVDWKNENEYYPKDKVAFKVNSEGYETEVIDIEWELSKGGLLKPVVIVTPIEIDGVTVKRVSGNNLTWLKDRQIGEQSIISIIRSGGVIPKIIDVKTPGKRYLPVECPSCKSKLQMKGVDLACLNPDCGDVSVKRVASFLRSCGVEDITEKSLVKFGINTFEELIAWDPNTNSKSQDKFVHSLRKNIWCKTDLELFSQMTFDGGGEKTILKLIEFYSWDIINTLMINKIEPETFPEGIGSKTIQKMSNDWISNSIILSKFCSDKRWNPKKEEKQMANSKLSELSFCFTGTLSQKRSYFEDLVKSNSGVISSVSKSLSYLIAGSDCGSKLDKATKLGIKIISEEDFMKMI